MRARLILAMSIMMNRITPNGGVRVPISRLTTRMMPKCTGSTPSATMSGNSVGVAISRIAVVSMKQPMTSNATLMIIRITTLLSEIDIISAASFIGACEVATIQPNGTAQAMMKHSTPQVTRVSRVAPIRSAIFRSRVRKPRPAA